MPKDTHRQFAHKSLKVAASLTSNDKTGTSEHIIKVSQTQQQFGTSLQLGTEKLHERISKPTGSAGSRISATVVAEMPGTGISKTTCPRVKILNHCRVGPLLRSEHVGCAVLATQGIGHVGREHKRAVAPDTFPSVAHRAEHPYAAIRRRTTAKPDNETSQATPISVHDYLPHAP